VKASTFSLSSPLPSLRQWKRWSLSNRIASVGLLLALIFGLYSIIYPWAKSPPPASHIVKDIQGIWYADYSYPSTGGTTRVRGTTEYFANGSDNFVGQMIVSAAVQAKTVEVAYDVSATNAWESTDKDLVIKVFDFKSDPTRLKLGDLSYDISQWPSSARAILPRIEDIVLKGTSEHFTIVDFGQDKMRLRAKDPRGNPFEIVATRVSGRFVRS